MSKGELRPTADARKRNNIQLVSYINRPTSLTTGMFHSKADFLHDNSNVSRVKRSEICLLPAVVGATVVLGLNGAVLFTSKHIQTISYCCFNRKTLIEFKPASSNPRRIATSTTLL